MFAYVKDGVVVRTLGQIPESWENTSNFHYADKAFRESVGVYDVTDNRPVKPADDYTYKDDVFLYNNGIVTWTATLVPPLPPTQDELDRVAAGQYAKLQALKAMTPDQVKTWVINNVNTLADAKDAITTLAIAVSVLARRI